VVAVKVVVALGATGGDIKYALNAKGLENDNQKEVRYERKRME
jgi:hypothetical protein